MANLSNINNYFVVDSTGKVAIGDVSAATMPTLLTQLTLYDNTATASVIIQSGAANGKKYELGSSSTGKFQMTDLDAGQDRLTIDTNGNVGIGTASPIGKTDIFVGATGYTNNITTLPVGTWSFANGSGGNSYPSLVSKSNATGAGMTLVAATDNGAPNGMDFNIRKGDNTDFSTLTTSGFTFSRFGTVLQTILRNGNVGIGTTSPNFKLDVVNAAASTATYIQFRNGTTGTASSDGTVMGIDSDGDFLINNQEAKEIKLYTSDAQRLTIDSSGNVGIGNISPGAKLVVGANVSSNASGIEVNAGAGGGNVLSNGTADNWFPYIDNNNYYSALDHIFRSQTNSATRMTIKSSGNVGIGTTTPDEKLSVDGNIFLQGNDDYIAFNTSASSGHPKIKMNADADFSFLNTAGNNIFHIENGGNVGIGTTSPGYLLDLYKSTGTSSSATGTTMQRLWNYVGGDLSQQKTFIDFVFQDNNTNEYPQVRIGAEVGQNGDANTQEKEGSGAFVVYTNNATGVGPGSPTGLAERFRVGYNGAIGIGGANFGSSGQVLTSNGNAAPSWQAAGGGGGWPQEKFAEYTINSTTSNILVATLNSTTWHGNYLAGCLKFTFSTSDYIQVTYFPVSTFLSAGNELFFKGTEMTTKNNGTNPAKITITFAGNNGSYGSTCTIKLNRNQSESSYTKVNVLIQAISSPNMFILN